MRTKTISKKSSSESEEVKELRRRLDEMQLKLEGSDSKNNSDKLTSDDDIEVMSLSIYPMTLNTKKYGGDGIEYDFENFGEVKRIVYSHLAGIINSHRTFVEYPYFYIMDERVIKRHGLTDIYSKILRKEQIEKILECDDKSAVELFKSAPTKQKEIIVEILVKKIFEGQYVDLNIVSAISQESGINILEKVRISKEISEVEEK